jgi:FixJ family two-component response regulator
MSMQKRRLVVAVVDDDPSMLTAAEELLGARGFMTSLFSSAEEFLASGTANEVDCLLLDIHLGGLSGIELRKQLKASHPALPVIFMTALEDMRQKAVGAGCVACLSKPFLASQLFEAIDKAAPAASQK